MSIPLELVILFLLILANGLFAMAEIAVVSSRRARLKKLADRGDARAKVAWELANAPTRFLSTVQVGITLIGILAGAFGGATLADQIAQKLQGIPWLAPYSQGVGVAVVVAGITFFSLLIGELVPKRIGLSNPEKISLLIAGPMQWLSRRTAPVVQVLSICTEGLTKLLGIPQRQEPPVSEDEIRTMIEQGLHAGVFDHIEKSMVDGVFRLDHLQAEDLMTPRARIVWLNVKDPDEANWRRVVTSGHSYFPVFEKNRDNVLGLVSVKSLWANMALAGSAQLRNLITSPVIVPVSMSASKLLETYKKEGQHIALVTDEFGSIQGLITLIDVLEAVVGEIPSRDDLQKPNVIRREDGSWLCDAMMELPELKQLLQQETLPGEQEGEFQSLAGFVLFQLGRIPKEGETFDCVGFRFEVLDMDRHRVDKILIRPAPPQSPAPPQDA